MTETFTTKKKILYLIYLIGLLILCLGNLGRIYEIDNLEQFGPYSLVFILLVCFVVFMDMWRNEILNKWIWYFLFFSFFGLTPLLYLFRREDVIIKRSVGSQIFKEKDPLNRNYFF